MPLCLSLGAPSQRGARLGECCRSHFLTSEHAQGLRLLDRQLRSHNRSAKCVSRSVQRDNSCVLSPVRDTGCGLQVYARWARALWAARAAVYLDFSVCCKRVRNTSSFCFLVVFVLVGVTIR